MESNYKLRFQTSRGLLGKSFFYNIELYKDGGYFFTNNF